MLRRPAGSRPACADQPAAPLGQPDAARARLHSCHLRCHLRQVPVAARRRRVRQRAWAARSCGVRLNRLCVTRLPAAQVRDVAARRRPALLQSVCALHAAAHHDWDSGALDTGRGGGAICVLKQLFPFFRLAAQHRIRVAHGTEQPGRPEHHHGAWRAAGHHPSAVHERLHRRLQPAVRRGYRQGACVCLCWTAVSAPTLLRELTQPAPRQVNKPYLPLASGDFSFALGQTLVVLCGAIALALGACASHAGSCALPALKRPPLLNAPQDTSPTRRR